MVIIFDYINMTFEYVFQFFLGGIIVTLLYYFSKIKNNRLCAMLPAIPGFTLLGLYYVYLNKGNVSNYLYNLSIYISITLSFVVLTYFINNATKNIGLSVFISGILWICTICSIQGILLR